MTEPTWPNSDTLPGEALPGEALPGWADELAHARRLPDRSRQHLAVLADALGPVVPAGPQTRMIAWLAGGTPRQSPLSPASSAAAGTHPAPGARPGEECRDDRPAIARRPDDHRVPPAVIEEIEGLCRRLRLRYIRLEAPDVVRTAKAQRWDPAELLWVLLLAEIDGRQRSTTENLNLPISFDIVPAVLDHRCGWAPGSVSSGCRARG